MRVPNRFFGIRDLASLEPGIRDSHISRNCSRAGKTHSTRDMYSWVGEHITSEMCFSRRRTLPLVICVSWVEEHISLGMKTHSTRDMCKAHSTRDMCKGGTRILRATHITVTSQ